MNLTSHRMTLALMGAALAAAAPLALAPEPSSSSAGELPPPKRGDGGNKSGHTPHQGKREMERRRKRMKAPAPERTADE
jgi:Spy/CpxP family protein refolding chaperone